MITEEEYYEFCGKMCTNMEALKHDLHIEDYVNLAYGIGKIHEYYRREIHLMENHE